jgi:hypothetical protein
LTPAPATSIYGRLRPGDVLRSGRVRIEHVGGSLIIFEGERVVSSLWIGNKSLSLMAPTDPDRGIYPELERDAAVAASSSLKPQASRLPLVRTGQGDFARDLNEEDLR